MENSNIFMRSLIELWGFSCLEESDYLGILKILYGRMNILIKCSIAQNNEVLVEVILYNVSLTTFHFNRNWALY